MCFLLAFYLINTATGQSLHHVCGSDYDDASYNCMKNPRCPNGDGCPADKATCFALPEDACLSLTESPTPSPAEATNNIITTMPTISHRDAIKTDVAFNKAPKHVFVCGDDYNDAAMKCMSNQKCSNGDECAFKTTCYAIPAETCDNNTPSSVQGGSYVASAIEILAPSPSVTSFDGYTRHPTETFTAQPVANTTLSPSYAALNTSSPTLAPTQNTRFCGTNYTNAVDNCAVERACVDGFECGVGETCYAGIVCSVPTLAPSGLPSSNHTLPSLKPTVPFTASENPTDSFTIIPTAAPSANTQSCGFNYTDAVENCDSDRACSSGECSEGMACFTGITCPVKNVTYSPTPAPTKNTQFCGFNWTEAVDNCSEDRACPSGYGCQDGMTCYITGNTCSSEMESPTSAYTEESESSTAAPTSAPNTKFCGSSMFKAWQSCSTETACPLGNECGNGESCFPDIICPSTAITTPPTPAPSSNAEGSITASSSPPTTNHWYCGSSPEDAAANCAVNQPCPDGTAHKCSSGQTCFSIPHTCTMPTSSPTKDLSNITSFCGANWNDAKANCYTAIPCTPGSIGECPNNQGCFEGILDCKAPNVTGAAFSNMYVGQSGYSSKEKTDYDEYGFGANPNFIRSSSFAQKPSLMLASGSVVIAFMKVW